MASSGRHDNPPGVLVPVPQDPRTTGLTYEPFYGLREKPFSLTSDARFFYQSRSHAPAFDDLLNAIRRRESLNVLTGDIGTGKTTLCRAVLQSLDRKTFSAFVPDPFATREDLLKILLIDFGVVSIDDVTSGRLRDATRTELSYLLYEFLGTLAPLQAFAVVFIDEAQNLSVPLLEETRILSDADGQLQVVLVGQLELRDKLKLPEMRQLDQRVSVHCQLSPLDLAGVAGYIAHRLRLAGGSPDRVRFTGDAVEAIYDASGGVPRIINRMCDRALRQGYARRASAIDREIVEAVNPPGVPIEPPLMMQASASAVAAPQPEIFWEEPVADEPVMAPVPPAPVVTPVAATPVVPVVVAPAVTPAPFEALDFTSVSALDVPEPEDMVSEPVPVGTRAPLSSNLEHWLSKIEQQPQAEPPPADWRERWAPTNAISEPTSDRRSGVRLRIRSGPQAQQLTQVERLTRRAARRLVAISAALIVLFGALVLGPASIGASVDLLVEINEAFTPPSQPNLPPAPPLAGRLPAPPPAPVPPDDIQQ